MRKKDFLVQECWTSIGKCSDVDLVTESGWKSAACTSGLNFSFLSGRVQGSWRPCALSASLVWVWCLRTNWAWIEPSLWGVLCRKGFLQLPEKVPWEHAWGYGVACMWRDLLFFLKVWDDLLVSCLLTEVVLAESVPRACRCLMSGLIGRSLVRTGKV